MVRGLLIAVLGVSLAACGFRPLYGERANGSSVITELASIDVAPTERSDVDRTLNLALEERLHLNGPTAARYRISFESRLREANVAVRQDANVTRKNIHLTVKYELIDLESGEKLLAGDASSIGAYNRVDSEFANIIASRDAAERVAGQVADDIALRLAVYFERQS